MKKILLALTVLAVCMCLSSCKEESMVCKDCHIVTYENGSVVSEGTPERYCGSQLESVEGQTSTVGDMTTVMVCQ